MTRALTKKQVVATALAVLVVAVSLGGGAYAGGGSFSDVPPSNPFAEDIEAIAGAGITTGFPDGTYRPNQNVTRGAMAAFMGRGFSSVSNGSRGESQAVVIAGDETGIGAQKTIASVEVDAGAAGSGTGFVLLQADISATTFGFASCPCEIGVQIQPEGVDTGALPQYVTLGTAPTQGYVRDTITAAGLFPIEADTTEVWDVVGVVISATADVEVLLHGSITATYVPFYGGFTGVSGSSAEAGVPSDSFPLGPAQ